MECKLGYIRLVIVGIRSKNSHNNTPDSSWTRLQACQGLGLSYSAFFSMSALGHWCSLTRELHALWGKGYAPSMPKRYLARFNAIIRHSGDFNENTVNKRLTTALYNELITLMA
jgi:hypothetical protein